MSRFTGYWFDLKTLPGDARMAYRREGWTGVWKAMASRSLHRIFRRGRLIVFAHRVDQMVDLAPPAGVRISQPTAQEWPRLASLVGQRELQRFRALSTRGRRCVVAWRGETPVGYAWVANDLGPDVAPSPLPLVFPSSAAYLLSLYVLPAERSSGIGSALASARLRLARETGFVEGWRMVAPTNAPSLRTVQKTAAGTRLVGEIRFVQLLGRTHARFTPSGR
jgi:GNAT superfamily N-acetyltransferase